MVRHVFVLFLLLAACGRKSPLLEKRASDAGVVSTASSSSASAAVSAPFAASSPVAVAPSASAPIAPGNEHIIVWGESAGAIESHLLEWTPERLEVLGKQMGTIVFGGGSLYRWRETIGKGHGLNDCDEAFNPGDSPRPGNRFTFEVKGAKVERLDQPGELEIEGIPELENMAVYSNTVTLDGSVGPYLFISNLQDSRHCLAAHDGNSNSYQVFDLEKGRSLSPPLTLGGDLDAFRSAAGALLPEKTKPCADAVLASGSADPPTIESMSLESAVPKWSKQGDLRFELAFSISNSHVQGVHGCSVEVKVTPPSLAHVATPRALAEVSSKLEGFTLKGWSIVPAGNRVALDAAHRVFEVRTKRRGSANTERPSHPD
jgi:hypothetical protein